MDDNKAEETYTTETDTAAHTKEQLLASQKYANRRDVISALLEDGKTYTLNEVEELMNAYLKGTVI
jgi:hypothetical protein